MAAFPADVITDILSLLPVNSLLRFKCVCKSWYSLIKSPDFIKLHLNQTLISNSNRHLLAYVTSFKCADFNLHPNHLSFSGLRHPLRSLSRTQKVYFYGSCNGVVCISDANNNLFLYNPLTKSHRKIPSNPILNLNLYFMIYGFGYDSKSDDYKVLRIVQTFKNQSLNYSEAQVYSVNNNSWKCVEQGISYCVSHGPNWKCVEGISYNLFSNLVDNDIHGVFVNEALHYLVFDVKKSAFQYPPSYFIASFDVGNESFSFMDCPATDYKDDDKKKFRNQEPRYSLCELGGCLCYMVIYYTRDLDSILHHDSVWRDYCETRSIMSRVDLWVMKEYGKKESWVKLFSIRQAEPVWCGVLMNPMFYSKDGRRILLHIDNTWFGWYDLESNTFERYTVSGLSNEPFDAGVFVGSLVSLQGKMPSSSKERTLPRKLKKKNDLDKFLSTGFKLKL